MSSCGSESTANTGEENLAEAGQHFRVLRGVAVPHEERGRVVLPLPRDVGGSTSSTIGSVRAGHIAFGAPPRLLGASASGKEFGPRDGPPRLVDDVPRASGFPLSSRSMEKDRWASGKRSQRSRDTRRPLAGPFGEAGLGGDSTDAETLPVSGDYDAAAREWRWQLSVPRGGSVAFLGAALSTSTIQWILLLLAAAAAAAIAVAQRQLYVCVSTLDGSLVEARNQVAFSTEGLPPAFVLAVSLTFSGVVSSLLLLSSHVCFGVGLPAERDAACLGSLAKIALLSFWGLLLAAFGLSRSTWAQAVFFNPLSIAPFAFLLSSTPLLGPAKRLPWKSCAIIVVVLSILALVAADSFFAQPLLLPGVGGSPTPAHSTPVGAPHGHPVYCAITGCGGVLIGMSLTLWERYFLFHPLQPLYAVSIVTALQVALLPLAVLFDMVPHVGYSSSGAEALGRLFDLPAAPSDTSLASVAHPVDVIGFASSSSSRTPSSLSLSLSYRSSSNSSEWGSQSSSCIGAACSASSSGSSSSLAAEHLIPGLEAGLSSSLILFSLALAAYFILVVPLVSRCPALLLPVFAAGPLAASIPSTNPLALVVGGVYLAMQILLLLSSEPVYDEEAIAVMQRGARMRSVLQPTITWRHGCSVLYWCRLGVREPHCLPAIWFLRVMGVLGWVPLSAVLRDNVRYTKVTAPWWGGPAPWRRVRADSGLVDDELQ